MSANEEIMHANKEALIQLLLRGHADHMLEDTWSTMQVEKHFLELRTERHYIWLAHCSNKFNLSALLFFHLGDEDALC